MDRPVDQNLSWKGLHRVVCTSLFIEKSKFYINYNRDNFKTIFTYCVTAIIKHLHYNNPLNYDKNLE